MATPTHRQILRLPNAPVASYCDHRTPINLFISMVTCLAIYSPNAWVMTPSTRQMLRPPNAPVLPQREPNTSDVDLSHDCWTAFVQCAPAFSNLCPRSQRGISFLSEMHHIYISCYLNVCLNLRIQPPYP
jgi:hypothetical protein